MKKFLTWMLLGFVWVLVRPLAGQTVRVEVKEVYLSVLVFDKGKMVNLNKENFRVFEGVKNSNGQVVWVEQNPESLSRYQDQGIALAFALDSSGSMREVFNQGLIVQEDKLTKAKNAAHFLLKTIFRPDKDQGLIAEIFLQNYFRFGRDGRRIYPAVRTSLYIDQEWSSDLLELETGINRIKPTRAATPLRDALFSLARKFSEASGGLLRVAVVLSDGGDTPDTKDFRINDHQLDEVIAELQNKQVLVYSVGLYQKPSRFGFGSLERDVLEETAEATGGMIFFERDLSQLNEIFYGIGELIRQAYFLSYRPKDEQEGSRLIRVKVGEYDSNGKWRERKYNVFHRRAYEYKSKK